MPSSAELMRCRLSKLPADWSVDRLGAIADTEYGVSETTSETPNASMIGMKHLGAGAVRFHDLIAVRVDSKTIEKYRLSMRDLVFNRTNSFDLVGKTSIVGAVPNYPVIFASYLVRIHLNEEKAIPEFVNCFMNSYLGQSRIKSLATPGVSQYNVNPTSLRNQLLIPLPRISEQREIAAIISLWDRAIELTEKLIVAKQKLKQAFMLRILTGSTASPTILNTVLRRISDPVDVQPSKTYRQIGIRSHGKGVFHKEQVTGKSLGNKRVYWVKPGCFTFNVVFAWEQAVARTSTKEIGMIASHRFPMYEPVEDRIDIDYLLYFFKTMHGKHLLGLASPGGAGRNRTLSQDTFMKLKIPLPEIEEQRRIAKLLSTADREMNVLERLRRSYAEQKKGLMQQLLTGKTRVKLPKGTT